MTPSLAQPETPPAAGHDVRCLEVWGGTQAVETTLNLPGIDAWIFSQPYRGDAEGGDIHYVSSCFTGRVSRFALADVSGHGSVVAELSGTLRKLMRKHINFLDQTGFARVLNHEFAQAAQLGRFATALLMSYFAPTDHLIICNAGHPRPLWRHAATGQWQRLEHTIAEASDAPNNLPLGVIDPTQYVQFAVKLEPDDMVLMYTDSLIEAQAGGSGAMLGEDGLLNLVQRIEVAAPRQFGQAVLREVEAHRGGAVAEDDQTLLVLHHNATQPPNRPVRSAIRYIADLLGLAGD